MIRAQRTCHRKRPSGVLGGGRTQDCNAHSRYYYGNHDLSSSQDGVRGFVCRVRRSDACSNRQARGESRLTAYDSRSTGLFGSIDVGVVVSAETKYAAAPPATAQNHLAPAPAPVILVLRGTCTFLLHRT